MISWQQWCLYVNFCNQTGLIIFMSEQEQRLNLIELNKFYDRTDD